MITETTTTETDRYARSYGSDYDGELSTKEIAAIVRKRLRKATKLAGSPIEGWTVKVRYSSASMSTAIDTYLRAPEGVAVRHNWTDDDYQPTAATVCTDCGIQAIAVRSERPRNWNRTDAGYAAQLLSERMLEAFNHDGSDVITDYFDVKFYGHTHVLAHGQEDWL